MYGSSRLGMWLPDINLATGSGLASWDTTGHKRYELDNHLSNVIAAITDVGIAVMTGSPPHQVLDHYLPMITSAQDYYAFGMLQPGRQFTDSGDSTYRYGFNGKENDNTIMGLGNSQDYGERFYDVRVGRFRSVDPFVRKYPQLSPFQFDSDDPINFIDLNGLEKTKHKHNYDPFTQTMTDVQRILDKKIERFEIALATMSDDQITELLNKTVTDVLLHPQKLIDNLNKQSDDFRNDGLQFIYLMANGQSEKAEKLAARSIVKYGPLFLFPEEEEVSAIGETEIIGSKTGIEAAVDLEKVAGEALEAEEKTIPGAHFYSRHGAQTTRDEQWWRANTGMTPDEGFGKPVNSTRFLSNRLEAEALAEAKLYHAMTGEDSFTLEMNKIVGEGYYKNGDYGDLIQTSKVQVVFKDGQPYTFFPLLPKK